MGLISMFLRVESNRRSADTEWTQNEIRLRVIINLMRVVFMRRSYADIPTTILGRIEAPMPRFVDDTVGVIAGVAEVEEEGVGVFGKPLKGGGGFELFL